MLTTKQFRLLLLALVSCVALFVLYYIATHGRITINNRSDDTVTIVGLHNDGSLDKQHDISDWSLVRSGDYMVRNDQSGHVRMMKVHVPGWLQSVSITYSTGSSAKIERLAALTYEHFFRTDADTLASYTDLDGYVSGYTLHDPTDAFGGHYTDVPLASKPSSPVVTSDGFLTSFHDGAIDRYSFSSNTSQTLTTLQLQDYADEDTFYLQRSSDSASKTLGLYEKGTKELRLIPPSGNVKKYSSVITGSRGEVFDVNDAAWAVVTNKDKRTDAGSTKDEDTPLPYSLIIKNTKSGTQQNLDIGTSQSVNLIALSPDGKYVAVNRNGQLWIYDAAKKQVEGVNPFTLTNQLFWQGTKLYSLSTDLGITLYDTVSQQFSTISLNATDSLSFSQAIPQGSKLYVTAFSKRQPSKLPDGYVIDLDQKSDGLTEKLAQLLPISTESYDINYLKNTIYIRVKVPGSGTPSLEKVQAAKDAATKHLKAVVSQDLLSRCRIEFVN